MAQHGTIPPTRTSRGWRGLSIEERFWSRVDERGRDECWPWLGAHLPTGYGHFSTGLFLGKKTWPAHRLAYLFGVGDIPAGCETDHLCRNRGCVNPRHLEAVTKLENVRRGEEARNGVRAPRPLLEKCKKGLHDMKGENVAYGGGVRYCRSCRRARRKRGQ